MSAPVDCKSVAISIDWAETSKPLPKILRSLCWPEHNEAGFHQLVSTVVQSSVQGFVCLGV